MPVAPNYATCASCRRRNQLTLDKRCQQLFDARVDYEDELRCKGFQPWQEIAALLGFGKDYMYTLMQTGKLPARRDPWNRLWLTQKVYKAFLRRRSKKVAI